MQLGGGLGEVLLRQLLVQHGRVAGEGVVLGGTGGVPLPDEADRLAEGLGADLA